MMCLLSAFIMANAQQALWSGSQIVSPQINEDNTVTFRLFAPSAQKVQVTGDFLPPTYFTTPEGEAQGPGIAELAKNSEGVWEFTTPSPLAPELYSYSFIVDGLKMNDPSNVYVNRDVATLTNIFIIGGEGGDLYKVNDVPHGSVTRQWYYSPTLDTNRRLSVYTPPRYEQGDREYPVLYLLHGMGGDEEAWLALGRTAQILDNLIARGEAEPMIVVMTNGNVDQDAAPGESYLGLYPPTFNLPHTMDGIFEISFPDVVKFIESNYRTKKDKHSRAIAGLSMGGFHSMNISKNYPDMFDYVGLFSAAITPIGNADSPIYADTEKKLAEQFAQQPALYWIAIGDKDFLYEDNVKFRKLLDEKGYPYIYFESPDGHIWKNWRIYLTKFVPQLFKTDPGQGSVSSYSAN